MKPKKMSPSGFTLIEMIVVIIIIAILAAIGVPQYLKATEKTRAAEAIRIAGAIKQAEDRYFARNAQYVTLRGEHINDGTLNNLDLEVQSLKYFAQDDIRVVDGAGASIAIPGNSNTAIPQANGYSVVLARNTNFQYTPLSGFGTAAASYVVVMDDEGVLVDPTPLALR